MVRSTQRSQDKLMSYLASLAYQRTTDVLLVPSVGWLRDRIGIDFYAVDGALDFLSAMGTITVERNPDRTLWIDLAPRNAY